MVVDAVSYLDIDLPLNMIGIKKVSGGSIRVSFYYLQGTIANYHQKFSDETYTIV